MADGDTARHELYRRLEEVLGAGPAGTLMASLPPEDWSSLATKRDVAASELATRQDIAALRESTSQDIAALRESTSRDLTEAVLRLERAMAEQSGSFERALRTELSKQSRAAVAGMVAMTATVGGFVLALLALLG
jgi:hypothetical protein